MIKSKIKLDVWIENEEMQMQLKVYDANKPQSVTETLDDSMLKCSGKFLDELEKFLIKNGG